MYDLIVIGAAPGGYEAAAHAGQMGKTVVLVEEGRIGGTCLNIGCIPAKAFLRSSRLYRECGEAKLFGVEIDSFRFDMPVVVQRKNRVVGTLVRGVEGLLKRSGVTVVNAHARLVGRGKVQAGDELLEAANILIATGSRPVVPPIPGIGSECVLDSSSVFDLDQLPARVAIIGGGYIGLEFATFFSEAGAEVVVFEMLGQVASGCDGDVSERLLQSLKRSGVTFHLGCRVLSVADGAVVYSEPSGEERTYVADRVLNATGRAPVVDGLGLAEIGVDFGAKGVRIDERGRPMCPACGPAATSPAQHMLAHVATREAIVAVNNMFGRPDQDALRRHPCRHLHPPRGRKRRAHRGAVEGRRHRLQQGDRADGHRREVRHRKRERHGLRKGPSRRQVRGIARGPRNGRFLERVYRGRRRPDRDRAAGGARRQDRLPSPNSVRSLARGNSSSQVGANTT